MVVSSLAAGCQNNTISLDGGEETEGASTLTSTGPGEPNTTGPQVTTSPSPDTGYYTSGPDWTTGGWDTDWTDGGWTDGWDTDWTGGWMQEDLGFDTDGATVSFFADVAPILQTTCAPNCHEMGGEWPTLEYVNSPWFSLVGVPAGQNSLMNYVEPGSLDDSYLWHKINGTQIEVGGSGLMMPKAKVGQTEPEELSAQEFETIALWILQGAPNN